MSTFSKLRSDSFVLLVSFSLLVFISCKSSLLEERSTPTQNATSGKVIPLPLSITEAVGSFTLKASASILVEPRSEELVAIGQYLADKLRPSTGYNIQVLKGAGAPTVGDINLTTVGADPALGEEGYLLKVTNDLVTVVAYRPTGLFRAVQTIRQLLPPAIESPTVQPGPWQLAATTIRDLPRFVWRGAMLDVARHFFSVQDVKRYIDLLAYYKFNRFHIHLTDDQGWRIVINSWPNLAVHGGSTQVGGGQAGFYTQEEYSDIVAYAQRRYIMVVPEIDMPGHTNAALASYAVLNCDDVAPPLYTGIKVGFSALCVRRDTTFSFVKQVIGEIAALTPGAFIHIGGDEAHTMNEADYARFVDTVQAIVRSYNKQMIGWEETAQSHLHASSIAQHWNSSLVQRAVQQGTKVIMSPAKKMYLDMQYDSSTPLGQNWAGYIEIQDAYSWDPATHISGVTEADILGVEAPLWTEKVFTMADIEYMSYPRLACYAEIGWSAAAGRTWDEYKKRLATHGPRLSAMGVNFYRSPQVQWN